MTPKRARTLSKRFGLGSLAAFAVAGILGVLGFSQFLMPLAAGVILLARGAYWAGWSHAQTYTQNTPSPALPAQEQTEAASAHPSNLEAR